MSPNNHLYLDLLKRTLTASLYEESAWRVIERSPRWRMLLRNPVRFFKGFVRHWGPLLRALWRGTLVLAERRPFNASYRQNGRDWPYFGYTMVGHRRLENIEWCIEEVLRNDIPGDLIETGAWRGGTVIFMRALLKMHGVTDRTVWVADSFEGLPAPKTRADGHDLSFVKYLAVSLEQVKANFERFGLLDDQVRFLKGWFCDTLPSAPIQRLAILRLDGDLYSSTMDSLRNLYHRVSQGGYVIVDDYHSWPSCGQAVNDFLKEHNLRVDIQEIDGHAVYWKVEAPGPKSNGTPIPLSSQCLPASLSS